MPTGQPFTEEQCAALREALVRSVARTCPPWLADRREDIVQAALMRVLQVATRAAGGEAPPGAAYLWRVGYSATVDEIRRVRRRREVALDLERDDTPAPPGTTDPESARRAQEAGRGLHECLRSLDEPRRLAVALHLQGHSVPEAARILGWTVKRVENLVYRGLADLRRCLVAKGLKP